MCFRFRTSRSCSVTAIRSSSVCRSCDVQHRTQSQIYASAGTADYWTRSGVPAQWQKRYDRRRRGEQSEPARARAADRRAQGPRPSHVCAAKTQRRPRPLSLPHAERAADDRCHRGRRSKAHAPRCGIAPRLASSPQSIPRPTGYGIVSEATEHHCPKTPIIPGI
jgi:hypothetical protein